MKWTVGRVLTVVLVGGFLLRLGAAVAWEHHFEGRFTFGDSDGYWELARTIAHAEPYQYGSPDWRVFRAPGYPLLLAPVFLLGGDHVPVLWGRVLSALFGTATIAAVWWLGRRLFGDRAGLTAAAITAVYPGAIAMSIIILSEAPFCPLMVAQLALWTVASQTRSWRRAALWALGAGLLGGAATLVRPSWLLFTPVVVAISVIWGKERIRETWLGCLLLLGLVVAMVPWWVRNFAVTGHLVATTLQTGASLYDGVSPMATGASDMAFVPEFVESERRRTPEEAGGECFEYRLNRRLQTAAVEWGKENPLQVAVLAGKKFLRIWNIWPNEPRFSGWLARIVVVFTFVPILVLGIIGALRTFRYGWPYRMCWLPAVYLTVIHMVFVSSVRYREPAMLGMIVLAAAVAVGWRGPSTKEGCCPLSAV